MSRLFVPESLIVTVGPDSLSETRIIDLGGPCLLKWEATLLSFDPDGLPTGEATNENLDFDLKSVQISDREEGPFYGDDSYSWFSDRPYPVHNEEDVTPLGALPETRWRGTAMVPQFVKIAWHFCTAFSQNPWEGGGHPVATTRFDMVL